MRVVLFVVLKEGVELNEGLVNDIKVQIRKGASPRHVPAKILQINDIPETKSGKVSELVVRDIVEGREVKNTSSLRNPESLDLFRNLPELSTQ